MTDPHWVRRVGIVVLFAALASVAYGVWSWGGVAFWLFMGVAAFAGGHDGAPGRDGGSA